MSASAKPRLAGRQPFLRGGVPRVTTWRAPSGVRKRGPGPGSLARGVCQRVHVGPAPSRRPVAPRRSSPCCPSWAPTPRCRWCRPARLRYVNLDTAASAPALAAVADRVAEALPFYASVHRAPGYLSQVSTALYESARDTVAAFVGAREDDVCVFTRHTTDALNLLAACVPPGERVARPRLRAPRRPAARGSAAVPSPCCRPRRRWPTACGRSRAALAGERYALVAVTGASNVTGEALPLGRGRRAGPRRWYSGRRRRRPVGAASRASPSPGPARTTSPSPGTSSTPRTAAARWSAGVTGSTRARRTWPGAARCTRSPSRRRRGPPRRTATRAGRRTCSAPSRWRPPARPSPALPAGARERARARAAGPAGRRAAAACPACGSLRIWSDSADAHRCRQLHRGRRRPGAGGRLPVGRARRRRPRRPILRPPARWRASACRRERCAPASGVGTTSDDVDRLVDGVRGVPRHGPSVRYAVVQGRWQPVDDPVRRAGLAGLAGADPGAVARGTGCGTAAA